MESLSKTKQLEVILPLNSKLTPETIHHLDELFEFAPPGRLREHLQSVFFSFLIHEYEMLPVEFEEMVTDLQFLFEFLDSAEKK